MKTVCLIKDEAWPVYFITGDDTGDVVVSLTEEEYALYESAMNSYGDVQNMLESKYKTGRDIPSRWDKYVKED